ncbi:MAG: HU family DNA-binding protein [Candidatus Nitrohelix vancouverensis]|uniref:HU family DNA-binding protein n=1 Tax=Candidatus Nitrohelix vancouverensis TaxID=2705534 RepID=A0A7T0C515_9BACT|nr:MAG: HU family DNA-binding protein [Candidatus Nitrohelix vancouverensis]
MTRADLVTKLSLRMNVTKKDAEKYLNCFLDAIVGSLERNERVVVQGFGSFSLKTYAARKTKKPITGEPLELPERSKPVFQPGKELRLRVNREAAVAQPVQKPQRVLKITLGKLEESAAV